MFPWAKSISKHRWLKTTTPHTSTPALKNSLFLCFSRIGNLELVCILVSIDFRNKINFCSHILSIVTFLYWKEGGESPKNI